MYLILTLITLLSFFINGFLALYIYLINPKKTTNRVFAVLALLFAIFSISEFIARIAETKELALIGGRICYSAFIFTCALGVHFSLVFPRKYSTVKDIFLNNRYFLIFIYLVAVIIVILFNLLVSIQDVNPGTWGYGVNLSASTMFLVYWLLFCTFFASFSLMHTYFKKNIRFNEKKQIQYVIISFLLIVVISLGTNLIPPLFNLSVVPMASLSLALFSLVIVYSMIKYKLMGLTTAETADIVVDTMADSLLVIDENKNIVNVNKSTLDLLGYPKNKLMSSSLGQILNLYDFESQIYPRVVSNGKLENVETVFLTKDGRSVPMYISASAIYDINRNLQGIVFVGRDLRDTKKLIDDLEKAKNKLEDKVNDRTKELLNTNKELQIEIKERKKAEEQIRASLKEKEILLKEIHHRVKNNLQIISSLLNLQAADLEDKGISEQFEEIQKRIKSMSLIHEQLYKSKDLTRINFDKYIYDLTANLSYSYGSDLDRISLKTKTKDISLNIDQAIPCGLIINELMSNSIKHGFPRSKKGEILVDFHLDKDNNYTLIVSDNGVGLPDDLDFQSTESLGLKLVNLLTKQLKGTIELDRSHGTKFKIIFPNFKNKIRG